MWSVEISIAGERTLFVGDDVQEVLDRSWDKSGRFLDDEFSDKDEQMYVLDQTQSAWEEMRTEYETEPGYYFGETGKEVSAHLSRITGATAKRLEEKGVSVLWDMTPALDLSALHLFPTTTNPLDDLLLGERG